MSKFYDFIFHHKDFIAIIVAIIVGFATIVTSITSVILTKHQIKISEKQNQMQDLMNQPIFEISLSQQQDSDDGLYGTDILEINNIGDKMTSCDVSVSVFFCLSKYNDGIIDTLNIKVDDYFLFRCRDYANQNNVNCFVCPGNNRIFANGYLAAIEDSKKGDAIYFYDMVILVRIVYKDKFKKEHTLYFNEKNEIDETTYNYYFEKSEKDFDHISYRLDEVNYSEMKELLDKRSSIN